MRLSARRKKTIHSILYVACMAQVYTYLLYELWVSLSASPLLEKKGAEIKYFDLGLSFKFEGAVRKSDSRPRKLPNQLP